ncbi:hypothetical protein LCGC14_2492080 [marine sediment metagenome]|uniref:DNA methylase N-4/N-6 domain-containing protein n=1 Tax=marine sediment metagenome TaxID=412755 RepID=A0A0F9DGB4_9ZZZZ
MKQLVKNRTILHGDVIDKLLTIKDESIDCAVWSPPYFKVRDYDVEGQWGLETNIHDYLENLRQVMAILKRKLKPTGTCWVNLGDKYMNEKPSHPLGLEQKTRLGIPERFYISAIDSGWIARNHIPWFKTNPMPFSGKDRLSNVWESVFFFTKSRKYYFNLDAIRIPTKGNYKIFNVRVRDAEKPRFLQKDTKKEKKLKQDGVIDPTTGRPKPDYKGFNKRWKENKSNKGKNPGDVWVFSTQPFPDAHFATFPEKLITRILKAGCPKGGMVLDPFFGAGTTGLVAERLRMKWIVILQLQDQQAWENLHLQENYFIGLKDLNQINIKYIQERML